MLNAGQQNVGDRLGSAVGAVLVQLAMASMFLWGLGVDMRGAVEAPLRVFNVIPPPPPPPPEIVKTEPPPRVATDTERQRFTPDEEGGSSPPNLRSTATPVVAPPPRIPLPVRSPIVAAPRPNVGAAPTQGAADIRGPGYGSGGYGDGTGSGYGGDGGGGGDYGPMRAPERVRGRLRMSDIPMEIVENGVAGEFTVGVIYTVLPNGRVTECQITRSSGIRLLDYRTCEIIEQRYVYDPERDWRGRPSRSRVTHNETWVLEDLPPEPTRYRRRGGFRF